MRYRKPFSKPSWIVGRDFPHPDTRSPIPTPAGSAPIGPAVPDPNSISRPAPATGPATIAHGSAGFRPSIPVPPPSAGPPTQTAAPEAPTPNAHRAPSQLPPRKPRTKLVTPGSAASAVSEALTNAPSAASEDPGPDASPIPPLHIHRRKCSICNHPDRADIETAFLNWQPADGIVRDYNLPSRTSLYRHAEALNLNRHKNLQSALDHIIERVATVTVTGSDVIRAIELSLRMAGVNVAPLMRYEVTYKHEGTPIPKQPSPKPRSSSVENVTASAEPSPNPPASSLQNNRYSNRYTQILNSEQLTENKGEPNKVIGTKGGTT